MLVVKTWWVEFIKNHKIIYRLSAQTFICANTKQPPPPNVFIRENLAKNNLIKEIFTYHILY